MEILPFDKSYFVEAIPLFIEYFSEPNFAVTKESAKKYLEECSNNSPEFCHVCLVDGVFAGAIFAKKDIYPTGDALYLDSIFVKNVFRSKGVAKSLLAKVFEVALLLDIRYFHMSADGRKNFPMSWYEDLGFVRTGWVELMAETKDLNLEELAK